MYASAACACGEERGVYVKTGKNIQGKSFKLQINASFNSPFWNSAYKKTRGQSMKARIQQMVRERSDCERTPRAGNQSNRQITKRIKTNETRRHSRSSQTCLFLQARTSMPESKQANSMKVTTATALKG